MTVSGDEGVSSPREFPLGENLCAYVAELAQHAPGAIVFRTGSGRLFRDLLIHWPVLKNRENEAQEICQRITDAIFPLVGELYAQAVEIAVSISPTPIEAPAHIDALSTYVVFDTGKRVERICYLSPLHPAPSADLLRAEKGIVVLSRPLHYLYHTINDDRKHTEHPRIGFFELPQRLINELYERPPFVALEKEIVDTLRTKIYDLPKTLERDIASRSMTNTQATITRPDPTIPVVSSLSGLPTEIQSLERILLMYITDASLSPDFRAKLRQIAQALVALYPQALIREAANYETAHPALKASPAAAVRTARAVPKAFPKATPVADVGKLSKIVRMKLAQTPEAS